MEDADPGPPPRTMSSMASSTDVSVESESGGGGWFGGLGEVTCSITRSLKRTGDGIADVIHRSAMNVAAEFAEMEREAEHEAHQWRVEQGLEGEEDDDDTSGDAVVLPLPWELKPTGRPSYVEDKDLKKKIFALSLDEATFKGPHGNTSSSAPTGNSISSINSEDSAFSLDDSRVYLIKRLLDIDQNLAHIHARLSGRSEVKETIFWKNYFHRCDQLRDDHTMRDEEVDAELVESPSRPPHPSSPSTPKRVANVLVPKTPTSPPKVLSMEDLVLVGGEGDDLDHLAADISRESKG